MTTHNDESLKPCHKCGRSHKLKANPSSNVPGKWCIWCYDCDLGIYAATKADAIAAWNGLAQTDAAAIRNAALEDAAKEFDRRDDGSGGFYDPAEPAEIIRALQSTTPAEPVKDHSEMIVFNNPSYQAWLDDAPTQSMRDER